MSRLASLPMSGGRARESSPHTGRRSNDGGRHKPAGTAPAIDGSALHRRSGSLAAERACPATGGPARPRKRPAGGIQPRPAGARGCPWFCQRRSSNRFPFHHRHFTRPVFDKNAQLKTIEKTRNPESRHHPLASVIDRQRSVGEPQTVRQHGKAILTTAEAIHYPNDGELSTQARNRKYRRKTTARRAKVGRLTLVQTR